MGEETCFALVTVYGSALMTTKPFLAPMHLFLDKYTLPLFRTVKRALDDWVSHKKENHEALDHYLEVKLNFFFSNVLCWCFYVMRLAQSLERMNALFENPASRRCVNPWSSLLRCVGGCAR